MQVQVGAMAHDKIDVDYINDVATLLWPSVGVKPNTWKK